MVNRPAGWSTTVAGPVSDAAHVAPPSVLTSMKMSKKLSISVSIVRPDFSLVRPSEALVGLSRILRPPGRLPPWMVKASISVSK